MSAASAPTQVLVADDELGIRSTLADILRSEGYGVMEAADGEEALEVLRSHTVDVALLDVRMPRRDGIDVLRALDRPATVLVISAFDIDPETRRVIGDKVYKFVRKPVPPGRLLQLVSEAASMPRLPGRPPTGTPQASHRRTG